MQVLKGYGWAVVFIFDQTNYVGLAKVKTPMLAWSCLGVGRNTHTFVAALGEFTPALEDTAMIFEDHDAMGIVLN